MNDVFAGTSENGMFLSTNSGSSWAAVNNGLPSTADVNSIAINGSNIFAGTFGDGVYLSANTGGSWIKLDTGLTNLNVDALSINGGNIFAGTYGGGVYLSTDNGAHWTAMDTGLTGYALDVSALATTGDTIFAGTATGVYVSLNKGGHWDLWNNTGFTDSASVYNMVINEDTLFAGTARGVWKRALSQVINHTGIKEINNISSDVTVYPNPALNNITINNTQSEIDNVQIFDAVGNLVLEKKLANNKTSVDISQFSTGLYFLKVEGEKGVTVRKFIKE
jgi:hypothetical protein